MTINNVLASDSLIPDFSPYRFCNFYTRFIFFPIFILMQKAVILFVVLLITALCPRAQDINGFWKGRLVMEPGGCFPVYNIEFQLQIAGNRHPGQFLSLFRYDQLCKGRV